MDRSGGTHWLSGHIFIGSDRPLDFDRVILEVVRPCVDECVRNNWITSFFFIRYWELGPHIRLRMLVVGNNAGSVRSALERHVANGLDSSLSGSPSGPLTHDMERSSMKSLVWIPYQPEVARYGGTHGIQIAEDHFFQSSRLAFSLIEGVAAEVLDRSGVGLASMMILLGSFASDVEEAAGLARFHQLCFTDPMPDIARLDAAFAAGFERQASLLTPQINQLWMVAKEGKFEDPLSSFQESIVRTLTHIRGLVERKAIFNDDGLAQPALHETIRRLAPSYMHMTNNRLGISRIGEAFLGHAIWNSLPVTAVKRSSAGPSGIAR